jgi:hypothetical protein
MVSPCACPTRGVHDRALHEHRRPSSLPFTIPADKCAQGGNVLTRGVLAKVPQSTRKSDLLGTEVGVVRWLFAETKSAASRLLRHDLAVFPDINGRAVHPGCLASYLGGSPECAPDSLGKSTRALILWVS